MIARRGQATRLAAAFLGAALALPAGRGSAGEPVPAEQRLVEVIATVQQPDPFYPWQSLPTATRRGYAIQVGPAEFVTTETLVRNSVLVELRRPRSGRRIRAAVGLRDWQVNLALLRLDAAEGGAPADAPPRIEFAPPVTRGAAVEALQLDDTGEIQRAQGSVHEISMAVPGNVPNFILLITLLTTSNLDGEGSPVFQDGRLAGMVVQFDAGNRTGQMLPQQTIERFIADAAQTPYPGVPAAGFSSRPLLDPVRRRYLGVAREDGGVHVVSVVPGAGADGVLKPDDVLLAWDGHAIDSLGYYQDAVYGRIHLGWLIQQRRPGETAKVQLVRGGQPAEVDFPLRRYDDDASALIPENVGGARAAYLVAGGLILRELDGYYLRGFGADWRTSVDSRLGYLYMTRRTNPSVPGERVVILSSVLPDAVNVGYQHLRNEIVTHVNGKPVSHMADVLSAVDGAGGLDSVRLKSEGIDLAFDRQGAADADRRLAEQYRIPRLRAGRTP